MVGAILGDIIGSPFEFDRGDKTKDFVLFSEGCGFTDDTVMTAAVAAALLAAGDDADVETIKKEVCLKMREWGRKYPKAGYGERFRDWLYEENPKPYGSYGNGSAMRVSAAGWLYSSLERTREAAAATACIYLARNGVKKEGIKEFAAREFSYDLSRTLEQIRPAYEHVESCQETVPEAIIAFLEAENFEEAIRNAVSLGGDTDTLAAITGSIAEAFFGIPEHLKRECRERIDNNIREVLEEFEVAKKSGAEMGNSTFESC